MINVQFFFLIRPTPRRHHVTQKESVELFRLFVRRLWKDPSQINDAIPHTRIDMAHRHARWGTPRLV